MAELTKTNFCDANRFNKKAITSTKR